MLDENEWARIEPLLNSALLAAKRLSRRRPLEEANELASKEVRAFWFEMTGHQETNWYAIYHHRRSKYGRACPSCGQLLRTPAAAFCSQCGWRPRAPTKSLHSTPR